MEVLGLWLFGFRGGDRFVVVMGVREVVVMGVVGWWWGGWRWLRLKVGLW